MEELLRWIFFTHKLVGEGLFCSAQLSTSIIEQQVPILTPCMNKAVLQQYGDF